MKRAFRSPVWLQALVFFMLFGGLHFSSGFSMGFTQQVCKTSPPVPVQTAVPIQPAYLPQRAEATAHDTWLSGRKLLQIDDGPGKFSEAFADVLPSATANAVVHGRYVL